MDSFFETIDSGVALARQREIEHARRREERRIAEIARIAQERRVRTEQKRFERLEQELELRRVASEARDYAALLRERADAEDNEERHT